MSNSEKIAYILVILFLASLNAIRECRMLRLIDEVMAVKVIMEQRQPHPAIVRSPN